MVDHIQYCCVCVFEEIDRKGGRCAGQTNICEMNMKEMMYERRCTKRVHLTITT